MIPKLRFPEFNSSWKKLELSQAFDYFNGKAHEQFIDNEGSYILVNSKFISTEGQTFKRTNQQIFPLQKDDICMVLSDVPNGKAIAKCFYISQNNTYTLNQRICALRNRNFVIPKYAFYVINRNNYFLQFDNGVGQTNLRKSDVLDFTFNAPDIEEQKKIASVLTTLDQKINLLTKKKEALETYKKGLMQKIFSQELRFKREDGADYPEWESLSFSAVFDRVKRKNKNGFETVLTISAQLGLVDPTEYFSRDVSSSDKSNYTLLHRNEFAYNKSYSKGYPLGAIKRNTRYDIGVLSPLYICFACKYEAYIEYYEQYFESGIFNNQIYRIAQEGARNHGLLNVSVTEFFEDTTLNHPSLEESLKISNILTKLDYLISRVNDKLEAAKQQKKGLLQQMFV